MSSKITGPLFKWFGSKWLSSKTLPKPQYWHIVEPFAGSAGYSLRHYEHKVFLFELDDNIRNLWSWLINEATSQDIKDIPCNLNEGTDIRTIGLNSGQQLLLKNWQRTNNVSNCWTVSIWGNKPGQWTENTRARIADQFVAVKHWTVCGADGMKSFVANLTPETWFIDPPYQYNYNYGKPAIDYKTLSNRILAVKGQKIVCEAICPTTGQIPTWLPFQFWANRITSRRKVSNNHHSKEVLWEGFNLDETHTIQQQADWMNR